MVTKASFVQAIEGELPIGMPASAAQEILSSLQKNYYAHLESPLEDKNHYSDILANLMRRQAAFQQYLIPWINLKRPLAKATVVDIGCGTGSSTAALAQEAAEVRGYEISSSSVAVASDRLKALGLSNASVTLVDPKNTIEQLRKDYPKGVDVIALIAVLEHMTVDERLHFLPEIWAYMRPGDILVVAELPNRLTYNDDHTAELPFFHMLPTQIKARYASRSKRTIFAKDMAELAKRSSEDLAIGLARWGIGLSFHDFEIGFGVDDLSNIILADGYEQSMLDWWPATLEEKTLLRYFLERPVEKPLAFCRSVINIIFVKCYPGQSAPLLQHDQGHIKNLLKESQNASHQQPQVCSGNDTNSIWKKAHWYSRAIWRKTMPIPIRERVAALRWLIQNRR